MALNAATAWEVQTGGSQNNGGGFYDRDPGTSVDYSQQAAAQLNPTDLAMAQSSTTLTSATGGFTGAMAGNIIHITAGTNFDVGWYEITVYTDTNTVTLDRTAAAGGAGSSGTGYVGGAFKIGGTLDDEFFEQLVAGNTVYIKAGTYTLGESVSAAADGTAALPVVVEGYNSSRGDNPTGTNRPLIDAASGRSFVFDDYWTFKNLRVEGTAGTLFGGDAGSIFINCKSDNSSETADRYAFYCGSSARLIGCEAICDAGYAIGHNQYGSVIGCYVHDSKNGIIAASHGLKVVNSIIDTCSTAGIDINSRAFCDIVGNTIYGCATGITGTTGYANNFINNIIDSCTDGATWSSEIKSNFWDYNCWNNTTDTTNITKGDNAVTADPLMTDPANGDFTLKSTSPCLDVGQQPGTNTGATGDYRINIGADQHDVMGGNVFGGVIVR